MRKLRVIATILMVIIGGDAYAQRTSTLASLPIGARVRLRVPDSLGSLAVGTRMVEIRGNVVSATDDTLTISLAQTTAVIAVARAEMIGLAVSHGRRSRLSSAWHAMRPASALLALNTGILLASPHSSGRGRAALAPILLGVPVMISLPRGLAAMASPTERWEPTTVGVQP